MFNMLFPSGVVVQHVLLSSTTATHNLLDTRMPYDINAFELITRGRYNDIKASLDAGKVAVNYKNAKGQTLLVAAVCCRQLEIAKYLIFLGADLETPDHSGKSARAYIHEMRIKELYNIQRIVDSFGTAQSRELHEDVLVVAANNDIGLLRDRSFSSSDRDLLDEESIVEIVGASSL